MDASRTDSVWCVFVGRQGGHLGRANREHMGAMRSMAGMQPPHHMSGKAAQAPGGGWEGWWEGEGR
jgi:hypothetical protein